MIKNPKKEIFAKIIIIIIIIIIKNNYERWHRC